MDAYSFSRACGYLRLVCGLLQGAVTLNGVGYADEERSNGTNLYTGGTSESKRSETRGGI